MTQDKRIYHAIYDAIFDTLTEDPFKATSHRVDPSRIYLSVTGNGGVPIHAEHYDHAGKPGSAGSHAYSMLVDQVPVMSPFYEPSGQSVETLYGQLVAANVEPAHENRNALDALHDARKLVFVFKDGKRTMHYTPGYNNYRHMSDAYDAAVRVYVSKTRHMDPEHKTISKEATAVHNALKDLNNAQPGIYQNAESVLGQHDAGTAVSVFNDARETFHDVTETFHDATTGHASLAIPSNWYDPPQRELAHVHLEMDSWKARTDSSFMKAGGGGGFDMGIFSIGGSGGVSKNALSVDSKVQKLSISFDFERVEIIRPWLNLSLFSFTNYALDGRRRGYLSNGKADSSNHGVLPLLPMAFIVASNLRVSAEWAATDLKMISNVVHGGGGFSIFGIGASGGATTESFRSSMTSHDKTTTITQKSSQIVGWISVIMPESPPLPREVRSSTPG